MDYVWTVDDDGGGNRYRYKRVRVCIRERMSEIERFTSRMILNMTA